MSDPTSLRVERGSVWTLTLERPEHANALSADLVERLHDVLDDVDAARPLAVVLRGNARHFAAGLDLSGLHEESDASLALQLLRIGLLLERLWTAPCLTVAVVEGAAVGAGADLVAACDHRLASPEASFAFPGSRFGVVLGAARLAALTGDLSLTTGRTVRASQAPGLATGAPVDLERILDDWSRSHPTSRPALLAAGRPHTAGDSALAALARSVAVPGLHARVVDHLGSLKESA